MYGYNTIQLKENCEICFYFIFLENATPAKDIHVKKLNCTCRSRLFIQTITFLQSSRAVLAVRLTCNTAVYTSIETGWLVASLCVSLYKSNTVFHADNYNDQHTWLSRYLSQNA